jgi:hypothetical protein
MQPWLLERNDLMTSLWPLGLSISESEEYDFAQKMLDNITKDCPELYLIELIATESEQCFKNLHRVEIKTKFNHDEFYKGPETQGYIYYLHNEKVVKNYPVVLGSWTGNGYYGIFSERNDILDDIAEICRRSESMNDWKNRIIETGGKIIVLFSEDLEYTRIIIANSILEKFPYEIRE